MANQIPGERRNMSSWHLLPYKRIGIVFPYHTFSGIMPLMITIVKVTHSCND
jgi:hypothetical protein